MIRKGIIAISLTLSVEDLNLSLQKKIHKYELGIQMSFKCVYNSIVKLKMC